MKLYKPGSIVMVKWYDAESIDAWGGMAERLEEHQNRPPVSTVGIVLRHNEDFIILARSYNEDDHTLEGTFQIPSGMITNIKKWASVAVEVEQED